MDGQLRTALQNNNDLDSIQTLSANKFPFKLWKIVNECQSGSIKWNMNGRNIIVHKSQFQEEYLDPLKKTFKTSNIGSFIRQLNLYGFKKVQPACKYPYESAGEQEIQEFHNMYFRRGRADLVNELRRHVGVRRAKADESRQRNQSSLEAPPAKFQKMEAISYPDIQSIQPYASDSKQHPPSLLAVPIYADGIPYLNASLPPVLVEWDEAKKRWEPKGPAIGAVMHCQQAPDHMPEGAQMGASLEGSSERYGHLVAAVSDALRSVPEQELQACLGPKAHTFKGGKESTFQQELSQTPSPVNMFTSEKNYGAEESPYPTCLCPLPQIQQSHLADTNICHSPQCYVDQKEFCPSTPDNIKPLKCIQPVLKFSPMQRCSSPMFNSPAGAYNTSNEYLTLKFSPMSISLSPINYKHESPNMYKQELSSASGFQHDSWSPIYYKHEPFSPITFKHEY